MNSALVAEPVATPADPLNLPGLIGTFMGRDALALAAAYLDLGAGDTVLLPAYNCKEVVRPFARRTRLAFYDVRPDLTVDPDELRARIRTTRIKMVLIINYFGFLQPFRKEVKQICAEQGAVLVEDCAHSLLTAGSGDTGDLSVYSFRKLLPLPDGGGLRVNLAGRPPNPRFHPAAYSNVLSVLSSAKSFFNIRSDTFSRAGIANGAENLRSASAPAGNDGRILPLSWFARRGLAKTLRTEIVERKREDFRYWQEISHKSGLSPVFGTLPDRVCPLGFPIRIQDRESIVSRARKEGIQLRVHWRLPATVEREYGNSYKLSTETLTLPVYPELGPRERKRITRLVTAA